MKFFSCPNLKAMTLVESDPWDFEPSDEELGELKKLSKLKRRARTKESSFVWDIYTPVRCSDIHNRPTSQNPVVGVRGFVADYDLKQSPEDTVKLLDQMPVDHRPQFIEQSLGDKIRLVWVFERELMTPSTAWLQSFWKKFIEVVQAPIILAGYDDASEKPQQMWTNGGRWWEYKDTPVAWRTITGVATSMGNTNQLFGASEVPLEVVAAAVREKFPNRWVGEFSLEQVGVRFWDQSADNPSGCQIKPDGMLCFTGTQPFVRWQEIFGAAWFAEQEILHLGQAAADMFFDGKNYFETSKSKWNMVARQDVILRLKNRGLSDRTPRGANVSEIDRVLNFIQTENRVEGAAPLINYPPGIVELESGQDILNIVRLKPFAYGDVSLANTPTDSFPWLWDFVNGLFKPNPSAAARPLEHFLLWLRRTVRAFNNHKRTFGQALFFCGPKSNGKTLLCTRIIAPLLGGRFANPYDYFVGNTTFNDDLFGSYLWAIHDEEAPKNEAAKMKFLSRLKSSVVNPKHTFSPKFCSRVSVDWQGRMVATLNDDPASVGMLPEVNPNTVDKIMFFATQEYNGVFEEDVEEIIARELPAFCKWLLEVYEPDPAVVGQDRMGVVSYFDPTILDYSQQQSHAYNLVELLSVWMQHSGMFTQVDGQPPPKPYWTGTPTDLMAYFGTVDTLNPLLRDWTAPRIAKCLTTLSKLEHSGVEFCGTTEKRTYRLHKIILDRSQKEPDAPYTEQE